MNSIFAFTVALGLLQGSPLHNDRVTPEVQVIRLVEPAVVSIQTNRLVEQGYYDLFGNWYRTHQGSRPYSQGSGVVIDPEGYLITNEHVVRGADQVKVKFNSKYDQKEYEASVVSSDEEGDLALLKIQREKPFPAVALGHSNDLMIGEKVIAIGNPYGEQNTVTAGILSAVGRDVPIEGREFKGLIQTDASINPGNSGGPLLNINGELIGINNAIHPLAEGIGFAIPVDRVIEILNSRLLNPEESRKIWIGARFESGNSAVVAAVESGSPAEKAGLKEGDQILRVDGNPVESAARFSKTLLSLQPGEKVKLRYRRGKEEDNTSLILGSYIDRLSSLHLGLLLETITQEGTGRIRVREALPEGPASRIGIQDGDILWGFNYIGRDAFGFTRKKSLQLNELKTLQDILEKLEKGSTLGVVVYRKGSRYEGDIIVR